MRWSSKRHPRQASRSRQFCLGLLPIHSLLYYCTHTPHHTSLTTPTTMSRNAQVEEVSDSDPEEVAPSDALPSNAKESILSGTGVPPPGAMRQPPPEPQREIPKHYQCLYPVYFDKTRSRAEGRKVGSELAVENPLAREIVDAVQMLGLHVGLEPEKLHPKDWANPGRVRVLLKKDGKLVNPKIKNSALFTFYGLGCNWNYADMSFYSQNTTSTSSSRNISKQTQRLNNPPTVCESEAFRPPRNSLPPPLPPEAGKSAISSLYTPQRTVAVVLVIIRSRMPWRRCRACRVCLECRRCPRFPGWRG